MPIPRPSSARSASGPTSITKRALFTLFAIGVLFFLGGCSSRDTVGLSDVELRYERKTPGDAAEAIPLANAVSSRLASARVTADVESPTATSVTITVDHALTQTVEDLLAWNGGVSAYAPADGAILSLEGSGLTHAGDDWTGRRADLAAAVAHAKVPDGTRVLYASLGDGRFRTRLARKDVAFVIMPGKVDDRGEAGSVYITPLAGAAPTSAASVSKTGSYYFSLGSTVLGEGAPPVDAKAFVLSFGHDFAAYTIAHETKRLLSSPKLPELTRVDEVRLPRNVPLFVGCLVMPFLVSLVWLWFIRRFDRAHPEPIWLLLVTFGLGNLSVIPAGFAEQYISKISPYADPMYSTMGGRLVALPLAVVVFTLVVGVVEEGVKCLAALFAYRRREFDEPVDGIVYGVAASLGFAAAENIRYFAMGRLSTSLVCARAFMTVPAHMFFGALWGYGFGEALTRKRPRRLAFFALAAVSHGAYDALLSTDGAGLVATLAVLGLSAYFVVNLRRSLRFGVLAEQPPEERKLFPMGNRGLFAASVVALHLTAFVLFLLGAVYQYNRHRVGFFFVSVSAGLLLTFGVLLNAVARTLPLDAVLDARGITFGGTLRAWAGIRAANIRRDTLVVDAAEGELLIGPGRPEIISALTHEIDARRMQTAEQKPDVFKVPD